MTISIIDWIATLGTMTISIRKFGISNKYDMIMLECVNA